MSETIDQIQAEFSHEFGRINEGVAAVRGCVRSKAELPETAVLDIVHEAYDRADSEYSKAVATRNARFEERAAHLRQTLFGAPSGSASSAFTNALMRAQEADNQQLQALASLAASTGDKTLGKAALAAPVRTAGARYLAPASSHHLPERKGDYELHR